MLINHNPTLPVYILGTGIVAEELQALILADGHSLTELVEVDDFATLPAGSHCIIGFERDDFRKRWISELQTAEYNWVTYIHPTAVVSDVSLIGNGSYIDPFVFVGYNAGCGEFSRLCAMASIGHGTRLGKNVFLGPKSTIAGSTQVGDHVNLSMCCVVKDRVAIASNCTFAMHTVVRKNVSQSGNYFNVGNRLKKY
jgi:UDP-3-O-[3-hydroxymyristoyl] glucosamine N-acyltransferase